MGEGYIKLSRKLFSSDMWETPRTFSSCEAWIDLIQSARFEATPLTASIGGREITYGRGQYPASIRFLSSRWKWTEKQVRSFLERLKKQGRITTECTQGMNIVTLCKYEEYNAGGNASGTAKGIAKGTDTELIFKELERIRAQVEAQQRAQEGHSEGTKKKKANKGEKINPIPSFDGLDLDFVRPDFLDVFAGWLEYKKERKEKYKSPKSLKVCYDNLVKLADGNPDTAAEIVNQSIGCNYAGLFELKKNNFSNRDNETNRKLSKSDKTRNLFADIAAHSTGDANSLSDEEVLQW